MSDYERFARTMPRRSAEEVLEALDENGRERTGVERMIHRMLRDQPWLIWNRRMPDAGGWSWGPDTSGWHERPEGILHYDYKHPDDAPGSDPVAEPDVPDPGEPGNRMREAAGDG